MEPEGSSDEVEEADGASGCPALLSGGTATIGCPDAVGVADGSSGDLPQPKEAINNKQRILNPALLQRKFPIDIPASSTNSYV
jgi:hypothetical protein